MNRTIQSLISDNPETEDVINRNEAEDLITEELESGIGSIAPRKRL